MYLNSINKITSKTSGSSIEPIQAASYFIEIDINFFKRGKKKMQRNWYIINF